MTGRVYLVVRRVHGESALVKEYLPYRRREKPMHGETRRIELAAHEENLNIDTLAQLLEFRMLVNQ